MANLSARNTNTSQFFITLGKSPTRGSRSPIGFSLSEVADFNNIMATLDDAFHL